MNTRIQQVLDGELARSALSAEEALALAETEAMIRGVLNAVPTRPLPDLGPDVMRRIEAQGLVIARPTQPRRAAPWLSWLWTPREVLVQWRPVYALGAAAALALLLIPGPKQQRLPTPATAVAVAPQVFIQFRLDAPHANNVALAGDFTSWKPAYTLVRSQPGVWTVVVPLNPGVHDYAFIVDGERWTPDPMAPAVADGFGGLNSRLAVMAPDLKVET